MSTSRRPVQPPQILQARTVANQRSTGKVVAGHSQQPCPNVPLVNCANAPPNCCQPQMTLPFVNNCPPTNNMLNTFTSSGTCVQGINLSQCADQTVIDPSTGNSATCGMVSNGDVYNTTLCPNDFVCMPNFFPCPVCNCTTACAHSLVVLGRPTHRGKPVKPVKPTRIRPIKPINWPPYKPSWKTMTTSRKANRPRAKKNKIRSAIWNQVQHPRRFKHQFKRQFNQGKRQGRYKSSTITAMEMYRRLHMAWLRLEDWPQDQPQAHISPTTIAAFPRRKSSAPLLAPTSTSRIRSIAPMVRFHRCQSVPNTHDVRPTDGELDLSPVPTGHKLCG